MKRKRKHKSEQTELPIVGILAIAENFANFTRGTEIVDKTSEFAIDRERFERELDKLSGVDIGVDDGR
jgi:hypothetical protein